MKQLATIAIITIWSLASANAQGGDTFVLQANHTLSASGSTRVVSIELDNPLLAAQGWSYGLCHDSSVATVEDIDHGFAYEQVGLTFGPQFFATNVYDEGFTVGVVVCGHACSARTIPVGVGWQTEVITYELSGLGSTTLDFCDGLGSPPVDVVVVSSGISHPDVQRVSGFITSEGSFLRADCNSDGGHDIADSIFLEQYLFLDGNAPACIEACDTNDDGTVNIADSIYALSALFSQGQAPPAPFPTCGTATGDTDLSCVEGQCP